MQWQACRFRKTNLGPGWGVRPGWGGVRSKPVETPLATGMSIYYVWFSNTICRWNNMPQGEEGWIEWVIRYINNVSWTLHTLPEWWEIWSDQSSMNSWYMAWNKALLVWLFLSVIVGSMLLLSLHAILCLACRCKRVVFSQSHDYNSGH